jgi:hypothetical protein
MMACEWPSTFSTANFIRLVLFLEEATKTSGWSLVRFSFTVAFFRELLSSTPKKRPVNYQVLEPAPRS